MRLPRRFAPRNDASTAATRAAGLPTSVVRVTSHISDKGQVTVRYYGLYANAHRGKVRKASVKAFPLRIVEEKPQRLPAKGWAEMIRN